MLPTSLESASFTLKVIAEDEENEDADCGRKRMVAGKGKEMPSTSTREELTLTDLGDGSSAKPVTTMLAHPRRGNSSIVIKAISSVMLNCGEELEYCNRIY